MYKTVMALGGSGNLGYYIVNELTKNGIKVVIADVKEPMYKPPKEATYELVDALDIDSIENVLRKHLVGIIVHLVGLPITSICQKDPKRSYKLNVASVHTTLEAMRKTDVKRIIFASAGIAYGVPKETPVLEEHPLNPHTVYGAHKAAAEYIVKAYATLGVQYVILRLFSVISDFIEKGHTVVTNFIERALKKEHLIVLGEKQARDFVYADDVAKAFASAVKKEKLTNAIINVGSGKPTRILEIAETVKKHFPEVEITVQKPEAEYSIYADVSKMKNLLGVEPSNPLGCIEKVIGKYVKLSNVKGNTH